jgi:hypothetical protein
MDTKTCGIDEKTRQVCGGGREQNAVSTHRGHEHRGDFVESSTPRHAQRRVSVLVHHFHRRAGFEQRPHVARQGGIHGATQRPSVLQPLRRVDVHPRPERRQQRRQRIRVCRRRDAQRAHALPRQRVRAHTAAREREDDVDAALHDGGEERRPAAAIHAIEISIERSNDRRSVRVAERDGVN